MALQPGFVGALGKLPVVEAWAEAACDGLRLFGALILAEVVVRESQGFREHPAVTVILRKESLYPLVAISRRFNQRLKVV